MFRADHVGSLLRPPAVAAARVQHFEEGVLSAEALAEIEDDAIRDLVAMQEAIGLGAVTDGEIRRAFWHYDFMDGLDGLDVVRRDGPGIGFAGAELPPLYPTVTGRLAFPLDHPMLDHFRFLRSVTTVEPKISVPGPSACHFRLTDADIAPPEYRDDPQVLFDDIASTYRNAVAAFYEAGCRYLQLDDIFFAYLCDDDIRAQKQAQGLDPDWLIERYAHMLEAAIADRPDDMTIAVHMCRGNFRSTWLAAGGYDPAAEAIFGTSVDVYFMEYDTERAGGLEPLRLVPPGKRVMPGFITTKSGDTENVEDVVRRFEAASHHLDIDQMGVAPQCGFASTEHGNLLSFDEQRRKLELLVDVAEVIWGGVA